ncbi:MAG: ice-binding family protein, partial [Fibrobacterota bacterium]|nr:ice-binding family protein [Fibrobacterota bacterium]
MNTRLTRMMLTGAVTLVLGLNLSMIGCSNNSVGSIDEPTKPGGGTGLDGAGKGPSPVILGQAGEYVILAKTGISTTGTTAVTGNLGVSPAAATFITGFSLISPPSTFSTSATVTGKVFASDYDSPTPANLTTAVLDMATAYTNAAGRAPDHIELGAGDIGGRTLSPAVYKWGTSLLIPSDVTLSGGAMD